MKDYGVSLNKNCPCSQGSCPIRGNCVLCVQNHLEHRRHLPECIQKLLRKDIANLSKMVELSPIEDRPTQEFWDNYDKEAFIRKSLKKHE